MGDDFILQEEIQSLQENPSTYHISNEIEIDGVDYNSDLERAVDAIAQSSESITDFEVFDVYRSLLKNSSTLPGLVLSKLLDSITSGLQSEVEATQRDIEFTEDDQRQQYMGHKQPLEMYAFLLHWFVNAAEKFAKSGTSQDAPAPKPKRGKAGKGTSKRAGGGRNEEWAWAGQIPPTLSLISKVLRLKTHKIWTTTADKDTFINCLTYVAYHITENEGYMKDGEIKMGVYKVVCLAVKNHGHSFGAQISIMQCLQYFEHLSEPMAEVLTVLYKEFDHSQLAEEILREISAKSFNAQDTKGPRSFSRFLIHLSTLAPRLVLKQFSLLIVHLDSEAYPMRMAMVEVIGALIKELAEEEVLGDNSGGNGGERREKKLTGLFELLMERFLDLSSYVRAKVINTLGKLWDLRVKFPKQRSALTPLVIAALEDKSSSVRRYAIALLTKMILTHPYGMLYGGPLDLNEWEARYEMVTKELDSLEGGGNVEEEEEDDEEEEERMDQSQIEDKEIEGEIDEAEKERSEDEHGISQADGDGELDDEATVRGESEPPDVAGAEGDSILDDSDEEEEEVMGQIDYSPIRRARKSKTPAPRTPAKTPRTVRSSRKTPSTVGRTVGRTPRTVRRTPFDAHEDNDKTPVPKKKKGRKSQIDLATMSQTQALDALDMAKITRLRLTKRYVADALAFIRQVEGAMGVLGQLLVSVNKAEVLESMEFFKVTWEYHFKSAIIGIKKMLHLIWTKDNSATTEDGKELRGVRSRLIECYRGIYFDVIPDAEPQQQVNRIAKNMIELTYDATLAELTSLEELLRAMMDDGQIHQDVVTKLWQVYGVDKEIPRCQRRGAIIILGMLAVARRDVVTERMDMLLKIGLGPLGKADLTLARYTCVALQRISGSVKKVKGSLFDTSTRLAMENAIFRKLQEAIEHSCNTKEWFGMAEQAINTIYLLGEQPDVLCTELIKNFTLRVFANRDSLNGSSSQNDLQAAEEESQPSQFGSVAGSPSRPGSAPSQSQSQNIGDAGDAFALSQLIFLVGHVAIKHIVYLELVERELKRRKDEAAKDQHRNNPFKGGKDGEELDQVAGNAEDDIGDVINGVRERELLYGPQSLLALFGPMIVHICRTPKSFRNQVLRTAATLSLGKLMCVSSQFCEENLLLLFKILETSKDPTIRSNIVIALGDVAVCFGNMIDENSNKMYDGLADKDLVVKKNTLMVLTHLILNGMIKVKGQLGEMAKSLEDEDQRIADLAKLFFTELSTKDNAIYNNLPDVISHLSVGDHAVDEEAFQSTMKYIFSFIEKEKQAENIVEKLCQRFRLASDARQWRDIAFCLSLLPFKSERSVKKLIEGLPNYHDKLHEETVFARFNEILTKARANKSANKPDTELKEFETILQDFKNQGAEEEELEQSMKVKAAAAKKKATRRTRKKKVVSDSE